MRQFATVTGMSAVRRRLYRLLGLALILLGFALALPAGASAFISTGDGGWFRQNPGRAASLFGVSFPNATHGWAVGGMGTILATTNGGVTWKRQVSGVEETLLAVTFVDARHGWAVGGDGVFWGERSIILATSNGGATWKKQRSVRSNQTLTAIAFSDVAHGWAVGVGRGSLSSSSAGVILATTNGGATWKAQDAGAAVGNGQLNSVAFPDATHGWAVGYGVDSSAGVISSVPIVLATTNGGATWKAQDVSGAGSGALPESVAFVDVMHGWAVGSEILATSDGGATWNVQDCPSGADGSALNLDSVTFVDATHGWAVGSRGTILSTTDGGATWHVQSSGINALELYDEFCGVAFPNATHGWAVGIKDGSWGGVIRATTSGGLPAPTVTPTVTLKLSGLKLGAITLGKRVTAKGVVTPTSLAGSKVKLTVQKRGARWVTLKSVARTISATGAYSWKYKPARRGAYRMRATIAKTAAHTAATTTWRSFKVK